MSLALDINSLCLERFNDYDNLLIDGKRARVPYFINLIQADLTTEMRNQGISDELIKGVFGVFGTEKIPFGWNKGKGTPEQISDAVRKVAEIYGYDLSIATGEGIRNLMRMCGIGLECSGLVYNLLDYALKKIEYKKDLRVMLGLDEFKNRAVYRAGVGAFARNSQKIEFSSVEPLDLLLTKSEEGEYLHMGIVIEENKELYLCQATNSIYPDGVDMSRLTFDKQGIPDVETKRVLGYPWKTLIAENRLEFGRLDLQ